MARLKLIRSSSHPYHVVNRVNNREWFPLETRRIWEIFCSELTLVTHLHGARVHAFVLMDNHFHLVLSTPEADLGIVMRDLLTSVSQTINRESGRKGHIFTGRCHRSLILDASYYSNVLKYVYRNPINAGLASRVEDYEFSTLHGLIGRARLLIPLFPPLPGAGDAMLPESLTDLVAWLNIPPRSEIEKAVRQAIRRGVFRFPKMGNRRKVLKPDSAC